MNLPKAIEILEHHISEHDFNPDGYTNNAIKLLIEAGERILAKRRDPLNLCGLPLPSETRE